MFLLKGRSPKVVCYLVVRRDWDLSRECQVFGPVVVVKSTVPEL